jgi:hypothetical protein
VKALLNCTRARAASVRNLAVALPVLGNGDEADHVRTLLSPRRQDDTHWNDIRDAAVALGFIDVQGSRLLAVEDTALAGDPAAYAHALRQRFAAHEAEQDLPASMIYRAYRRCLALPLGPNGAVPDAELVDAVGEPRAFNGEKASLWRDWVEAAGLGVSIGAAFCPVPALALRAELVGGNFSLGRVTIADFIARADELGVPLLPSERTRDLPAGTSIALDQLQEDSLIRIEHFNDAPEQWRWRTASESHITVREL